ncbi:MAG: response regulator [Myxococcales bacterium]|nr:response regulator [Myxococcales bacterium]MCB9731653.1 response regulator [Deltaproteobacteria bacterium]
MTHPFLHPDVLVVDDSKMMRSLLVKSLRLAQVPDDAIVQAENGRVALDRIRERLPGLVVTDVHMPEMTGAELLAQLEIDGVLRGLPVVVVTSVSSSQKIMEFIRLGAAAVIRKPVDPEGLVRELEPFLAALREPPPEEDPAVASGGLAAIGPDATAVIDLDRVLEETVTRYIASTGLGEATRLSEMSPQNRVLLGATIAIRNPIVGHITTWCALESAGSLALYMAGETPGDDVVRLDAIAELANQLVGEFVGVLAQAEGDPLQDTDFGLPSGFVVAPGVELPPWHQVYAVGEGIVFAVHVAVDEATEAAA